MGGSRVGVARMSMMKDLIQFDDSFLAKEPDEEYEDEVMVSLHFRHLCLHCLWVRDAQTHSTFSPPFSFGAILSNFSFHVNEPKP